MDVRLLLKNCKEATGSFSCLACVLCDNHLSLFGSLMPKRIFLILAIILVVAIISFENTLVECGDSNPTEIPSTIIYRGTKYYNCHHDPNYPVQTNKKVSVHTGVAEEEVGSRTYVYRAAVLNGKYLFGFDESLLKNFDLMLGEKVSVKGFVGQGLLTTHWAYKDKKIYGEGIFVSEIQGWSNVCGTTEGGHEDCFWYKNAQ